MGSRPLGPVDSVQCTSSRSSDAKMEAIKKKMQAMKVEKDNACDRVDVCEEACKAARLRASKGEDEVDELITKSRQLETELDLLMRSSPSSPFSWRRRRRCWRPLSWR